MRPFGRVADLDLNLSQSNRPELVTALLAQCGETGDAAYWWGQPVSTRTRALLRLVAITEQRDELAMSARCRAEGCGEAFEFALPLLALPGDGADAPPLHVPLDDVRVVTMRRPTGADLRAWREARPKSAAEARRVMLDALVLAGDAGPDDDAILSAALAMLDPLVDFTVACRCPVCGAANEVMVDLEGLALKRLATHQQALLVDVHRLARVYGWTESEVLAIPQSRRARYLALAEEQP